ncbi:hypothetical protein [Microbacterium sp. NPDC089696]
MNGYCGFADKAACTLGDTGGDPVVITVLVIIAVGLLVGGIIAKVRG